MHDDHIVNAGYRLEFMTEDRVIIELKAIDSILPIHHAQLSTYLKLSRLELGCLINFNVRLIKHGITRIRL
jgi:GxxExxY protein